jgi:hypothetical protein
MDRETMQDYLEKSGLNQEQAHALSRIFAEMATKSDLQLLSQKFDALERRVEQKFEAFELKFEQKFEAFRLATQSDLSRLEARLTWRIIGSIIFLGTVITLLNAFIV